MLRDNVQAICGSLFPMGVNIYYCLLQLRKPPLRSITL